MKRTLWNSVMMLSALLPATTVLAQAPVPYQPLPSSPAVEPAGPVAGYARFPKTPPGANELPPGHPPVDSSPSKKPLRDFFRFGRPLGCWSSFNGYGCGSLKSDAAFIFGSCRTFFGEPCLKGAPPSPLPPWAGEESGYRQAGPQSSFDTPRPRVGLRRNDCPSCGNW